MNESAILDWNPLAAVNLFPETDEEIVWAGQPSVEQLIPGYGAKFDMVWLYYYLVVFACLLNSFSSKNIWLAALAVGAVIFFQALPYFVDYLKLQRTFYIVTSTRIIIKTWRFFKEYTYILRYDDFQRTTYVLEEPHFSFGTVYLMTGKDVQFWTHDLLTGERREHPTIERIPYADRVAVQIEQIRVEKQRKNFPSLPK